LLELASKTKDLTKQGFWLKTSQGLRRMMDATDLVQKGDRKVLKKMDFDEKLKDPEVLKKMLEIQQQQSTFRAPGLPSFAISETIQDAARPVERSAP
jgi:hypothetical protein